MRTQGINVASAPAAVIEPRQSLGEEIANSVSHGAGLVAAIAATPLLLRHAAQRGGGYFLVGTSVFGATIMLLYLASTLYHALPQGKAKRVFQVIDHGAIFLLIAGTYTPFSLGVLRGAWGWTLLALVWALAVIGVILKAVRGVRYPTLSLLMYLGMGWLGIVAIRPLWLGVPLSGLVWLLLGGVAYTVGAAFFTADRLGYCHLVWHIFVLAGTSCHFIAVWFYAA
jgi:hemolysin III